MLCGRSGNLKNTREGETFFFFTNENSEILGADLNSMLGRTRSPQLVLKKNSFVAGFRKRNQVFFML